MISLQQIERLVEQEAFGRLVRRVLANGRCTDREVVERLKRPGTIRPAALGLAVQRICELSYEPGPTAIRLVRLLPRLQGSDGWFGSDAQTAAGTAVAVRGMLEIVRLMGRDDRWASLRIEIDTAIDLGMNALQTRQQAGSIGADAADAAIVLWQLGGSARFRNELSMSQVMLEVAAGLAEGAAVGDLCRLAYAAAA